MTQEEFGTYWSQGEETTNEKFGAYDLVALRLPDALVDERQGFAACLVGREGSFAGSFVLYRGPHGVSIKGRWCSPSGVWYSFRRDPDQDLALDELLSFTRRVIRQEDAFDPVEFGATRLL